MYWGDTAVLFRADLDGQNVTPLITGLSVARGVALDLAAQKLYWADSGTDVIQRSDLDGGNVETLVTGLTKTIRLALDVPNDWMYWTDQDDGTIQRAHLDGSGLEVIATGAGVTRGITVVPEPATMGLLALGGLAMLKRRQRVVDQPEHG